MQVHHRLHYHGRDLHHRRNIWNNISLQPNRSIIILGIGVFTGHTTDIMDMESPIVFDRSAPGHFAEGHLGDGIFGKFFKIDRK